MSRPQGCVVGDVNRPDRQLEVEPEEKFADKKATAAVVHLQDWASPKKKLAPTVKTLLYVNSHVVM